MNTLIKILFVILICLIPFYISLENVICERIENNKKEEIKKAIELCKNHGGLHYINGVGNHDAFCINGTKFKNIKLIKIYKKENE